MGQMSRAWPRRAEFDRSRSKYRMRKELIRFRHHLTFLSKGIKSFDPHPGFLEASQSS